MYRTFQTDLAIGKQGEEMVMSALKQRGHNVVDVSDNAEYRKKDIDIIISKNGQTATIEVKNDLRSNQTGNVYIEIYNTHNPSRNYDGWFAYCDADYLCFVQTGKKKAHIVFRDELVRNCWADKYRKARSSDTEGYIVPIDRLKEYSSYYCLLLDGDAEC